MMRRGANLYDPESVKEVTSKQTTWSPERKQMAVHTYSTFLKMTGGKWEPPRYKRVQKLPWIPIEQEVDQLIAGCNHRIATFLQLLKETGTRPGEAWQLDWPDIDFKKAVIYITPEKGSNPRVLPISDTLVSMLKRLQTN